MLLSSNAPIFYYSFLKIERTATGDREIPEANKITVRKHRDYKRIYKWKNIDKSLRDNTDILDKISILGYLEKLCDDRAAKAYASLRQGNTLLFRSFMESAVSCLWTYYVLYGVIGKDF